MHEALQLLRELNQEFLQLIYQEQYDEAGEVLTQIMAIDLQSIDY